MAEIDPMKPAFPRHASRLVAIRRSVGTPPQSEREILS